VSEIDPAAYYLVIDGEPMVGPFPSREAAEAYPYIYNDDGEELWSEIIPGAWVAIEVIQTGPMPLAPPVK
jgi:hypothetical protein